MEEQKALIKQLKDKREALEDLLLDIASQILDELEDKLMAFAESAGEKVFKAHPKISNQFDSLTVKHFKDSIREAASTGIEDIIGDLANEKLWFNFKENIRGKDSLKDNPKIWPLIEKFGEYLTPILKEYKYPFRTATLNLPYKETEIRDISQFPRHDQLRLLCLKYWLNMSKFIQLSGEIKRRERQVENKTLDKIWKSTK